MSTTLPLRLLSSAANPDPFRSASRALRVGIAGLALLLAALPAAAERRIAFSFDDVPRHAGGFFTPDERTERLLEALDRAGIEQAAFFVTTGNLETPDGAGGEERIRAYVAAGHVLGNHTESHPWLSKTPVGDYLADLDAAEAWLRDRPGHRPWFRFPYLDEGRQDLEKRDAVRAALRERGLLNAYVTVDNYDWHLDVLAARAREEGREIDVEALCELFTETLVLTAEHFDRMAVETLGRSPAHVLLLHETDLGALCLEDVVSGLRADGWTTISMDEAYEDPIADVEPETWLLGNGRVAALAHVAGRDPRTLNHERTDEKVLDRLFAERVLLQEPRPDDGPESR